LFKIFFSIFVSNQRRTLFKMATLTFRLSDHIFFICYLQNHMTWFCDFWSKIIGNILKFLLISCSKIFKLSFLESQAENMGIATYHFIQICPRFVSSILFILWIIIFETKLRFGRNPSMPFLSRIKKKLSHRKLPNW
jgi:hypothetical protein